MPSVTVDKLLNLITRSQLVEPSKLDAAIESLRASNQGRLPTDVDTFGEYFLRQELLTSWQLQKLLAGKTRGFQLGKYRLLSHLGRGGMGSVYLAVHVGMQRRVALKILPTDLVNDKSYLERFHREARVVAALDHPNIVRAYDLDQSGDLHYLVMEFIEGRDLAAIVKQRSQPVPVRNVVQWIAQTARALHHAHVRGIIHRDVKPSNLLIDVAGNARLLDLGLALLAGKDSSSVTVNKNEGVLGTADYLAPEQALDSHSADARADIYSLGCTLYFALAGHPPFHEGTIAQRIAQHQQARPASLCPIRPDVPLDLDRVCQKMLAKRPDDRYPTAQRVADELDGIARQCTPEADRVPESDMPTKASPAPESASIDGHPATDGSAEASFATDSLTTVKTRIHRPARVKKPPVLLWIALALLMIVAAALGVLVLRQS
jgi:serine/threonine-protein kinase